MFTPCAFLFWRDFQQIPLYVFLQKKLNKYAPFLPPTFERHAAIAASHSMFPLVRVHIY
jgi:hypothetical protein